MAIALVVNYNSCGTIQVLLTLTPLEPIFNIGPHTFPFYYLLSHGFILLKRFRTVFRSDRAVGLYREKYGVIVF